MRHVNRGKQKMNRKPIRDRLIWVLSRLMTPLLQQFDSAEGDSIVLTLERRFYYDVPGGDAGEKVDRYAYTWSPDDNADMLVRTELVKLLDPETYNISVISEEEEEIDATEFFAIKSNAGGALRSKTNISQEEQRLMDTAFPIPLVKKERKERITR